MNPTTPPDPALGLLNEVIEKLDFRRPATELLARLLDVMMKFLTAERAFLFGRAPPGQPPALRMKRLAAGASPRTGYSRTVIERVLASGHPAILQDLTDIAPDEASASLVQLAGTALRSVVACPLPAGKGIVGCLYLDSCAGLRDFSEKDLALLGSVAGAIGRLVEGVDHKEEIECENVRLRELVDSSGPATVPLEELVHPSSSALEPIRLARAAAAKDVSVLLAGETGTGKEVLAHFIHRCSARSAGPFVALNCAAMPEGLVESELFGCRRGAFTGADADRAGILERASGGTFFLDEVGELAPAVQAKLLRVLQDRVVVRLGETRPRKVDFRLISASHRNLAELAREGRFREDLYYRIAVLAVELPALRERSCDVPILMDHFIRTLAPGMGRAPPSASPAFAAALSSWPWPGNIRELRNVMERALVLAEGDVLDVTDLPPTMRPAGATLTGPEPASVTNTTPGGVPLPGYEEAFQAFEADYFQKLLDATGGNMSAVARLAGLTRYTVYRRMARVGLRLPPGEGAA